LAELVAPFCVHGEESMAVGSRLLHDGVSRLRGCLISDFDRASKRVGDKEAEKRAEFEHPEFARPRRTSIIIVEQFGSDELCIALLAAVS
jgi:hypothetical protein